MDLIRRTGWYAARQLRNQAVRRLTGYTLNRGINYMRGSGNQSWKRKRWRSGMTRKVGNYGRYNRSKGFKQEMKYLDSYTTIPDLMDIPSLGWHIIPSFNIVKQDITPSGRIGRKIMTRLLTLRFEFKMLPSTAFIGSDHMFRIMVFMDKQANGTAAAKGDLLTDKVGNLLKFQSFNNLDNAGRFKILMNKFITMKSTNAIEGSTTGYYKQFEKTFKIACPIEFAGTTGAVTEMKSCNIGAMIGSRIYGSEASVGKCAFECLARLRYFG